MDSEMPLNYKLKRAGTAAQTELSNDGLFAIRNHRRCRVEKDGRAGLCQRAHVAAACTLVRFVPASCNYVHYVPGTVLVRYGSVLYCTVDI